jgi:hypothetical protein
LFPFFLFFSFFAIDFFSSFFFFPFFSEIKKEKKEEKKKTKMCDYVAQEWSNIFAWLSKLPAKPGVGFYKTAAAPGGAVGVRSVTFKWQDLKSCKTPGELAARWAAELCAAIPGINVDAYMAQVVTYQANISWYNHTVTLHTAVPAKNGRA